MFTSSSFSISGNDDGDECDESEDELDDDVPWRSPSEKIAYVFDYFLLCFLPLASIFICLLILICNFI